jgi:hypothetical protein
MWSGTAPVPASPVCGSPAWREGRGVRVRTASPRRPADAAGRSCRADARRRDPARDTVAPSPTPRNTKPPPGRVGYRATIRSHVERWRRQALQFILEHPHLTARAQFPGCHADRHGAVALVVIRVLELKVAAPKLRKHQQRFRPRLSSTISWSRVRITSSLNVRINKVLRFRSSGHSGLPRSPSALNVR